jgi:hypothetical protein
LHRQGLGYDAVVIAVGDVGTGSCCYYLCGEVGWRVAILVAPREGVGAEV